MTQNLILEPIFCAGLSQESERKSQIFGGIVRFGAKVTDLISENGRLTGLVINETEQIACEKAILALGHSARDTFEMLDRRHIVMEAKAFAVGVRVEHPREMIDQSQYGKQPRGCIFRRHPIS